MAPEPSAQLIQVNRSSRAQGIVSPAQPIPLEEPMSVAEASKPIPSVIDVPELIANHKLGGYQIWVLIICAVLMFSSGFNMLTLGYMAPAVSTDLKLAPGALASVFVVMGFASAIAAFVWGPVADRFGRRFVVLGSLLCAVPFIFLMSTATSITQLMWFAFFVNLCLAGPQYNCMALASEFMPRHLKVTLTVLVWTGFSLGTILVSPYAAYVVGVSGWRSVYIVNGFMPIVLAFVAAVWLPESLRQLVRWGGYDAKIAKTLKKMYPDQAITAAMRFVSSEKAQKGFPVRLLFTEGRAAFTCLLWIMGFCNMVTLFFMNSWLTTVLHNAGFAIGMAILIAAVVHVGGIIGGISISDAFDRFTRGRFYVLATAYALAALFVASVGYSGADVLWTTVAVFVAGFFLYGVQNSFNAVASVIYPTAMRSTGASWGQGIGGLGQMVGPLLGGILLELHWPSNQLLYLIALPPVVSAIAAFIMGMGHEAPESELEGPVASVKK
jgi:AAHS family 4-hydroxybenzoate transporter-like MFS transporter